MRVMQDDGVISDYEQYFQKIPDSVKAKSSHWKKDNELRFLLRIASDDKAFEAGFYNLQTPITNRPGTKKLWPVSCAAAQRKNGGWNILTDADTGEDASDETFNKAGGMQQ